MIVKVTRGSDGKGLVRYLGGPGKDNVHENQRVIASSLGVEGQTLDSDLMRSLGGDLMAPSKLYPDARVWDGKGPIWHCSLSIPLGDRALTDAEWGDIAREFMGGMGFGSDSRWVAVHHGVSKAGNDHIHLAGNLVTETGKVINPYRDYKRASKLAGELEQRYGLTVVHSRAAGTGEPGLSKGELARAARTNTVPEREQLRVKVRAAVAVSSSEEALLARLKANGVTAKLVRGGKGWAVSLTGSNVWYPGGALGADLSINRVREHLDGTPPRPVVRNGPALQKAAQAELRALTTTLTAGGLSPAEVAGAAHKVAGALSVAAGQRGSGVAVRAAAREAGRYAGFKHPMPYRASLGSAILALQSGNDPAAKVAQAILVRQLLVTFTAVKAAHRVVSETRRQGMGMVEMRTPGALSAAHLAEQRNREAAAQARAGQRRGILGRVKDRLYSPEKQASLWTAQDIARSRIASDLAGRPEFVPVGRPVNAPPRPVAPTVITEDQARRIAALAPELGVEANAKLIGQMTHEQAAFRIQEMEFALSPEQLAQVEARLALPAGVEQAVSEWAQATAQTPNWVAAQDTAESITARLTPEAVRAPDPATAFEQSLIDRLGPEKVAAVEAKLAADRASGSLYDTLAEVVDRHAGVEKVVTVAQTAEAKQLSRNVHKPVEQWKTGMEPITPRQEATLIDRGYAPEHLAGMPKATASQHISGRLGIDDAELAMGKYPPCHEYTGQAKVIGIQHGKDVAAEALKPKLGREVS